MQVLAEKNILITGGTGFIGQALCQHLRAQGARLLVLTRQKERRSDIVGFITSLDAITTPVDIIINLAGEPIAQSWSNSAKQRIQASRLETTAALVQFMRTARDKPALFISASAIGYYGTHESTIFTETTPPAQSSPFARSLCAAWESVAMRAQDHGVRTVLLRLGAVLEKDGGMLAKLLLPFRLGLGGPMGHGRQWLSWIARDDVLQLINTIIENPKFSGPVNATAPKPVSNWEFAVTLARVLNRPCLFPIPAFALRAAFGDMADEIMLAGQHVISQKALECGFEFSYPELEPALRKILNKRQP